MKYDDDRKELVSTLREMAAGNEAAFRTFYSRHYNTFIRFGKLITGDLPLIEDTIQNILIWFIENPKKVSALDRPDVYIFRSMRNNLLRNAKKEQKNVDTGVLAELVSDLLTTESAEIKMVGEETSLEQSHRLRNEIANLPDYLQQTLYLRYFQDLSYDKISKILEIKPNVARIYVHRAIERLRTALQKISALIFVMAHTWH